MARPKKSKEERRKEVIRLMLSEIADSYVFIGILPDASIAVLERQKDLVHAITLDTVLERLNKLKMQENEFGALGGDLLGNDDDDENNS